MSVYERVQAQGSWEVKLLEGTPASVLSAIDPFSHVVIVPGRLQAGTLNDTYALGAALYTGVVLRLPGRKLTIGGAGLNWWLGDGNHQGALIEGAITQTSASLSTWVTAIRPSSLAAGTVTSPGGSLTWSFNFITRREALDATCRHFGVEWRVNPDFTLDAATSANLYGSTPTAITLPRGGDDIVLPGLEALVSAEREYDEFATRVIVSGPGGMWGDGGAHASYRDGQGNLVTIYRFEEIPSMPPESVIANAALVLARYSSVPQRSISVEANRYGITSVVPAGSNLYIYDPEFGLYDASNQVWHQGILTFPISVRVLGVRWAIEEGMAVYHRYWNGSTFSYRDLTPYVEFESAGATLEID